MGLASGSTNPYVILQPQAGTRVHPPIHPFTHPHFYSSSSIFLLTSVYLPAHLSLSPSRVHTFTHPPVHHVSRPHILSPIRSSSHTTSQLSNLFLLVEFMGMGERLFLAVGFVLEFIYLLFILIQHTDAKHSVDAMGI